MNPIFLSGFDELLEGILVPVIISLLAWLVRFALWGWTGFRALADILICCFAGIFTFWLLTSLHCNLYVSAAVVSIVGLFSREFFNFLRDLTQSLFSRRVIAAIWKRVEYEIMYRGRHR